MTIKIILILTLLTSGTPNTGGKVITTIEGFTSKETCTRAGKAWLKQVHQYGERATALCIAVN